MEKSSGHTQQCCAPDREARPSSRHEQTYEADSRISEDPRPPHTKRVHQMYCRSIKENGSDLFFFSLSIVMREVYSYCCGKGQIRQYLTAAGYQRMTKRQDLVPNKP